MKFIFNKFVRQLEIDLVLLGVVFVEEKIPSQMRYSLHRLINAGINVWIASGDSKQNVMSVAKNLELIKEDTIMVSLKKSDTLDELDMKMNLNLMQLTNKNNRDTRMIRLWTRSGQQINLDNSKGTGQLINISIHGECFAMIQKDTRLFQCFCLLLSYCHTLIGYSFSPANKYELTKVLKKFICKNSNVLAVGDGLNDFMMLKEADLSIGILSKEILQVRNSCDLIVSKFSQIVDIILVHGTWNYERVLYIIIYSLYAHVLIMIPFFSYQIYDLTGATFYQEDYLKLSLEMLVINFTIILVFCLEQFIERPLLYLNPHIYTFKFQAFWSILNNFFKNIVKGIFESFFVTFCFRIYAENVVNIEGQVIDGTSLATSVHYSLVFLVFFKLFFIRLITVNIIYIAIILIDIALFIGFGFITQKSRTNIIIGLSYLSLFLIGVFVVGLLVCGEIFLFHLKLRSRPTIITYLSEKLQSLMSSKIIIRLHYFH